MIKGPVEDRNYKFIFRLCAELYDIFQHPRNGNRVNRGFNSFVHLTN